MQIKLKHLQPQQKVFGNPCHTALPHCPPPPLPLSLSLSPFLFLSLSRSLSGIVSARSTVSVCQCYIAKAGARVVCVHCQTVSPPVASPPPLLSAPPALKRFGNRNTAPQIELFSSCCCCCCRPRLRRRQRRCLRAFFCLLRCVARHLRYVTRYV